jgi:UDP:flavonoid glycosyltransferase YjiC (YdhE family)
VRTGRIDFAWELGGHTGHVATLLPIARAMRERGHQVRFLLQDPGAGADLEGAAEIPRQGAPHWVGTAVYASPRNFGEILHNFGYHDAHALKQLVDAWRERMWLTHAVVASVSPAAHIAARTLGIPSFEISQGFHVPPPAWPAPPLQDWQPEPRAELEAADRRVVGAINDVLAAFGVKPIATIGELFAGRALLLTYPELDIYPERGAAEYYGVPDSGEGGLVPGWPAGRGPRVFAYLYRDYEALAPLLDALQRLGAPTLMLCRGIDSELKRRYAGGPVFVSEEPMSVSRLLPQCDLVACHASHQMTAQALLAGKPLLLLPTQLEQFLIMRRVVRYGAALGIAPGTQNPDFGAALARLSSEAGYAEKAAEFAARYRSHDRGAALATMVRRCEAALSQFAA